MLYSTTRIILFVFVSFLFSGVSHANWLSNYDKIELHRHEQCADVCRQTLDRRVFWCMKDAEAGKKTAEVDCEEKAYEAFRNCTKFCPANPNDRK